jgi:uncharacterized damage-inducible protein DinB
MNHRDLGVPGATEYAPYYGTFVALVKGSNVLDLLSEKPTAILNVLRGLPESAEEFRYAEGKWSVKEVLGHVMDCERVYAYRALCIARGERAPLPGFDENDYVRVAEFGRRRLGDIAEEFETVRRATLALLARLDGAALTRIGTANNVVFSARALAYCIAGHEIHHAGVLKSRYLSALGM